MNTLVKALIPAVLSIAALGAHAADTQSLYLGQNEAGPIVNRAYVAPVQTNPSAAQFAGQNEAGPVANPAFTANPSVREPLRGSAGRQDVTPATRYDSRYVG